MLPYYGWRGLCVVLRIVRHFTAPKKTALILPPAAPGSMGDDAMISALADSLQARGYRDIGIITRQRDSAHDVYERFARHIDLSSYFFGPTKRGLREFLLRGLKYADFYVIGADVLDGHYSDSDSAKRVNLASWAARAGMRTSIVGFSYNASPKARAVRAMKNLDRRVRVCVRDPASLERVSGVLRHQALQVADLAFLLRPMPICDSKILAWLASADSSRSPVVGINAVAGKVLLGGLGPSSEAECVEMFVHLVRRLAKANATLRFCFVPHDYRGSGIGEGPMLRKVYSEVLPILGERVYFLEGEYRAANIKWLCGRFRFVISGRMHLAIAALGQSTPVFCLGYQGKFEGLFELVKLPELLCSWEDAVNDSEAFFAHVEMLLRKAPELKKLLVSEIPRLEAMANGNIS